MKNCISSSTQLTEEEKKDANHKLGAIIMSLITYMINARIKINLVSKYVPFVVKYFEEKSGTCFCLTISEKRKNIQVRDSLLRYDNKIMKYKNIVKTSARFSGQN